MNLWAKRVGQLAIMLAVALFFFSCQDESSVLGFRNPNSKFKVFYVEIPIESSIYLRDSLRTSNFSYVGEVNRLLVGNYVDEAFGNITASAFSQFYTSFFSKVGSTAEYDSVSLQLRFDLYNYGPLTTTEQSIGVYELDQDLKSDSLAYYFNKTNIAYSTLLGSKSFSIDPETFNEFALSSTDYDSVITVNVPLDFNFGQRIFDSAVRFRDATSREDSSFVFYAEFIKEFKGIVIRPEVMDKMIGFKPTATETTIKIHYHEADVDSLSFNLTLSNVLGFNQITADRSASELSDVNQYYQDYLPSTDNRYIQSGTGILTKLDFSNFYEFVDTIPNILINSAELLVESVQPSDYPPPAGLSMRLLQDNNRMKKYSSSRPQDVADYLAYKGYLLFDVVTQNGAPLVENDSVFYANDRNALLAYSKTNNTYTASMPLFFQQLALKDEKPKFKYFVLYPHSEAGTKPASQSAAKTVNRAIFPKDKITLRVYYTKPITSF